MSEASFLKFLHETHFEDLPVDTINHAKRCLLDLIGVMAAGSQTRLSKIINEHAQEHFASNKLSAHIMFSGNAPSPAGAALANGMMIDSIDAHDGYKPAKGHIGCHVLPSILALREVKQAMDGRSFLTDFVVGYEIGARCAVALHGSAPDYHTSGAWGAVTTAALGSRILRLDSETTRHALGIAEYHGPRSQMMRVIDHPTMLKDGSGWGAMAGISATFLARDGFTGAPAVTIEDNDVAEYWRDLGSSWAILDQYFKPYPVCRWAQPATAAALALSDDHGFTFVDIEKIKVFSFHEACRLATRCPIDTEQAQYSLPFPVAAALVFGQISPKEIDGNSLSDERVLTLSRTMELLEYDEYNDAFPDERYAHVEVTLKNGDVLTSDRHRAEGDPETPLSEKEIADKYFGLAEPVIGSERAKRIYDIVETLGDQTTLEELLAELIPPA